MVLIASITTAAGTLGTFSPRHDGLGPWAAEAARRDHVTTVIRPALAIATAGAVLSGCGGSSAHPTPAAAHRCVIEFDAAAGAGTDSGPATMVATGADALTLCSAQSDPLGQMSGDAPSYQVDGPVPQGTPLCTYRDTTTVGITWAVWGANGSLAQTICALASPRSATP